ncbi:PFGI-1 class ICE element type IV pilus protein PilL2 [Zophobihabitans entericus]|uniref:Uncharacterized protein n=1 Tax=Zophobihabitans entericus TaxID=1635327 RepID=A0A6G9ID45_9GAMM|nr:hypothetical protein [Zophobihabitans entericus]QIQ22158.1 hypothetical protein IPMB12_10960 [Zophobihabitans entericus]
MKSLYFLLSLSIGFLVGCSTPTSEPAPIIAPTVQTVQEETIPVVRYGRYTLIELMPTKNQTHLLEQVIDVTIPSNNEKPYTSVKDAVQYVLLHSGYQLCPSIELNERLSKLPLPASHIHLGPLTLKDTLSTLVGSAYVLKVEESTRTVCFDSIQNNVVIAQENTQ